MLLLILGADPHTIPLLQALQRSTQDVRVIGWHQSDRVADQLAAHFPEGHRIESAEAFAELAAAESTVVIVGTEADEDTTERLLRDLARTSIPLVLQQPACSGIFAVELDMIQRDTQAPIVPYHPPSHHPVFALLAKWTHGEGSPVGSIEQVLIERSSDDRDDRSVHAELARDAILLRRLLGRFQQVGAMSAKETSSLANLSVQLTGEVDAVGRWSIAPVTHQRGAELSLVGQNGRIVLSMPDQGPWMLHSSNNSLPAEQLPAVEEHRLVENLAGALQGQPSIPSWDDAFRAMDLADLACESVRRGKTLPVSNVTLTEEDTFKGLMAAGGCLILLALPPMLLLLSLLDGLDLAHNRTAVIQVTEGQRELTLPGDVSAIHSVRLTTESTPLPALPRQQLFQQYGRATRGKPAAYSLGRNSLTLAPAADGMYQLELKYEGSFRIWSGWPTLLLVPIVLFLLLQLLRLAFPKQQSASSTQTPC